MATPATSATAATTAAPENGARPAGALSLTLEPVAREAFLAEHWERQPLVLARGEPGRFDGVLSRADAEHLVSATALRVPAFRLVKDGAQVPLAQYTDDVPWRPGSFAGTARVREVAERFADGATLVLQALHLHWLPAALYCRGLEQALGCPVQANAYYTPAAAQGFDVHHDTHSVFVLQVAGRKRWRIYAPVLELPLGDQKWSPALGDPGAPVHELELGPGDTLYVPRGWPHEAATSDEDSLHVTVGLHPPTRLDAVKAALAECSDDLEFRRPLSDGALPEGLLDRLADRLAPDAVARRARRRFLASRRPILEDQLEQLRRLESLGLDTPLARRDTVIADLEPPATLVFEGREVIFPGQCAEAVAAVHGLDGPFSLHDLPGRLDAPGRLVLARRLVREGYLRILR